MNMYTIMNNTIHMYSGITSGRVLDGEHLYTKILEVMNICFSTSCLRSSSWCSKSELVGQV